MDDHALIQMLFNRVEAVLEALAQRFGKRLTMTAFNILNNSEDAEECVNDTYLAVWNAIPPTRPDPLPPYVYRTGKNIALNRLRAQNAQKRSGYELSLEELANCVPTPSPDRDLGRGLNAWLEALPQKDRVIFLRRHWFGDSVKSIAKGMLMTESAVSVRLHRLKNLLKDYLTKEGYYE